MPPKRERRSDSLCLIKDCITRLEINGSKPNRKICNNSDRMRSLIERKERGVFSAPSHRRHTAISVMKSSGFRPYTKLLGGIAVAAALVWGLGLMTLLTGPSAQETLPTVA